MERIKVGARTSSQAGRRRSSGVEVERDGPLRRRRTHHRASVASFGRLKMVSGAPQRITSRSGTDIGIGKEAQLARTRRRAEPVGSPRFIPDHRRFGAGSRPAGANGAPRPHQTPEANGHQPVVSSNSTRACPSATRATDLTRPISTTEMPSNGNTGRRPRSAPPGFAPFPERRTGAEGRKGLGFQMVPWRLRAPLPGGHIRAKARDTRAAPSASFSRSRIVPGRVRGRRQHRSSPSRRAC